MNACMHILKSTFARTVTEHKVNAIPTLPRKLRHDMGSNIMKEQVDMIQMYNA